MKIKRYKKVNRHIQFYINNFNFRQPYQVLLDGTFCYAALNNQVNIADNIPRYLQAELKLLTTQCAIIEMEKLGPKLNGALLVLKQYPLHKCGHEKKPLTGAKCILSMVAERNPKHYIIATQDRELQSQLREIPGVPLLYLHAKTPVLDAPSESSQRATKNLSEHLLHKQRVRIEEMKKASGLAEEEATRPKRRKIKGPNPLSRKKKKKKPTQGGNPIQKKKETLADAEKKKRRKVRIPKHVKEELLSTK